MLDWIRENQLDIMLSLSSICGILAFFVVITGINGKKKKALFFLELSAMVLLVSDRFAYIYRGNVSDLGYWMVRISNFLVFAMTIMTVYCFGKYLKEMAAESDPGLAGLKRFRLVDIMLYIGELLLVISQFTGLYYTFDETNHYVRSDFYIISYILPFLGLVILLSIIVQYYKRLSKSMRLSVLLFTLCPLIASVCQLFLYGISATDITLVGTVVLLYIFDLLYMNKTAAESERAKAESNAKSAFLSNMSHEIRTPINAILGMNEMILRECEDENILEYSENVRTAGSTLLGIVNDILDFSKIEAGKMEIIPVDYDLSTVLNDLVNMIQTRADDKGLLLKLEFDRGIPKLLHGDEVRLKQVITNILTNAVKYTEKGSVTFGVTYEKTGDDSIDLKVWIKDTGIGIKPQDMEKLFGEFQRIEEERNRHVEGTGLGMSITRRLLEMMNSSLKVESVYGEGSTFSFILTQKVVKWDALGDYEAAYKASLSHHKKYREKFTAPDAAVLMVDDTPMNLTVFKSLLKLTGIRIDTATSGDEGLALARKNEYDIIFLDHMMPEKDGIETLHEMQSWEDYPNKGTKKVCLTANAISGAREQYLAAGFDNYLTKPIDSAKLEEMLLEYLPKHKILASDAAQSEPAAADNDDIIPQFVRDIAEIDIEAGIRNNGDAEPTREWSEDISTTSNDLCRRTILRMQRSRYTHSKAPRVLSARQT